MTTRADIVAVARSYLGVRWRHAGRTRGGLDCVGLLVAVSRDLGLDVVDTEQEYKRTPDPFLFLEMMRAQSDLGSRENIRSGSIFLLRQNLFPCHCGIVVLGTTQTFIHAAAATKVVSEEPLKKFYKDMIEVREYRGVS